MSLLLSHTPIIVFACTLTFLQSPRKIRFAETAERMERKLEEMGTVHDVSVIRTEWPSNVTGNYRCLLGRAIGK